LSYRGQILPPQAAAFFAGGGWDLPLHLAPGLEGIEPGRPLRLITQSGELLGLAVADPENDRIRRMTSPPEACEALDPDFFARRVKRALALRQALGLPGPRATYRIIHGAGDGLSGFTADVLGEFGVLHAYGRALVPMGREIAQAMLAQLGLRGVVIKVRARGAAAKGRVRQDVVGDTPPESLIVEEHGVPFDVHLTSSLNVGLFTDMREHRQRLARLAPGRSVLNLFAYTGTLSVIPARAGAAAVTSVDLSSGVLAWARDNFRLNGLDPDAPRFRFETADASRFLLEAAKQGRLYDLVLLDPPTFSAARGAPFALDKDYPGLVARSAAVLAAGGLLFAACNARGADLVALAENGLRQAGRAFQVLETGGLPADFPTIPTQPEDRYLQVALLRLT
jgi:23S rRNA (cytosine1962-C5)-methyltransferase